MFDNIIGNEKVKKVMVIFMLVAVVAMFVSSLIFI